MHYFDIYISLLILFLIPQEKTISGKQKGALRMFTQINSAGIHGMEGFLVSVESDVSNGLPGFSISGQLALEVREAQERVRTALKNSDLQLPAKKITVNLSPAGMKKEGTAFDLPIAAAVLGAFELLAAEKLKDSLLIGELGLDGSVKPVRGVLVLVSAAKKMGFRRCFLPVPNMAEGALVEGIQIIGIKSLLHLQEVGITTALQSLAIP